MHPKLFFVATIFFLPWFKTTEAEVAFLENSKNLEEVSSLFLCHSVSACSRRKVIGGNEADKCLEAHNYYRCLHGSAPLLYDQDLEKSAQTYVDKLCANKRPGDEVMKHSVRGQDRDYDVGENLAWRFEQNNIYNSERAVADWYTEVMKYNFDSPDYSPETGHFTQLVWKDTTHLGCAVGRKGDEAYVVVHYRKKGNIKGQFTDNVPKPINDVCEARCDLGSCQSNGCQNLCQCGWKKSDSVKSPKCFGNCVALCPLPVSHIGYWEERCEGQNTCTCSTNREKDGGNTWPGAQCT